MGIEPSRAHFSFNTLKIRFTSVLKRGLRKRYDHGLLLIQGNIERNWRIPFDCSNIFSNEDSHHNYLGNAL